MTSRSRPTSPSVSGRSSNTSSAASPPTDVGRALGISSQGVHGHMKRLRARGVAVPGETRSVSRERPGRPARAQEALSRVAEAVAAELAKIDQRLEVLAHVRATQDAEEAELKATAERLVALLPSRP
jgi:predicted ArsR family transcriptional regulator